jgi:hypothetical protein
MHGELWYVCPRLTRERTRRRPLARVVGGVGALPRLLYSKHISCILNIYLWRAYYGVYLFVLAVDTCRPRLRATLHPWRHTTLHTVSHTTADRQTTTVLRERGAIGCQLTRSWRYRLPTAQHVAMARWLPSRARLGPHEKAPCKKAKGKIGRVTPPHQQRGAAAVPESRHTPVRRA